LVHETTPNSSDQQKQNFLLRSFARKSSAAVAAASLSLSAQLNAEGAPTDDVFVASLCLSHTLSSPPNADGLFGLFSLLLLLLPHLAAHRCLTRTH